VRFAWFSPLPPTRSGIAVYSAELLPLLRARRWTIDVFTAANAHEFVWQNRRHPYDLTIYQLGNADYHDYMWAYLFRYPGLVVLHDAQLHQARALFLTRRWQPRRADYIAEVRANHPEAPSDLPYLVLSRLGDGMYQHWPMARLVIESARMTLVHNTWVAEDLRLKHPHAAIRAIEMGVRAHSSAAARDLRTRYAIPDGAFVLMAIGGVTPEKRIGQLIGAVGAIAGRYPHVHIMLVGQPAEHYDVIADAQSAGIADRVHVTGFAADDELAAGLDTADLCACLRWPTNRETSASWLRCLAASRPTLISELMHLGAVPTLDPRGWRLLDVSPQPRPAVAVSIDLLDEAHSLQLALERLVVDQGLRQRLGQAAYEWWQTRHRLDTMADAYATVIADALATPIRSTPLPLHLVDDGTAKLRALARAMGVEDHADSLG
jgi:glycosyltransferase involved in cell wall biosynthesis